MRGLAAGLDWRGTSGRGGFLAVLALWALLFFGTGLVAPFSPAATVLWPLAGGALYLVFGTARRRLRDIGASGWLLWLLLVPFVSLVFAIFLALRKGAVPSASGSFSRVGQIGVVAVALFVASRAFWEPYAIPAGSMKPTLRVGDYIVVTRARGAPERGDVVVFAHPGQGSAFVKRVLALAGETIAVQGGIPVVNGAPLRQMANGVFEEPFGPDIIPAPRCANGPVSFEGVCEKLRFIETTPESRSYPVLDIGPGRMDDAMQVTVPEGHLHVMGDNRDNSLDSRVAVSAGGIGTVPIGNIHGVARLVLFNAEGVPGRFFRRIE